MGGVRLPLQSLHGYGSVFMYSATTSPGGAGGQAGGGGNEVTLRLREPEDIPEEVLARLEDTATLSISLQGDAVLRLGAATSGEYYILVKEVFINFELYNNLQSIYSLANKVTFGASIVGCVIFFIRDCRRRRRDESRGALEAC